MNTSHEPTSRVVARHSRSALAVCGAAILALCILSAGLCQAGEKRPRFEDPVFFATCDEPWGLAAADAFENGYPDLAITHCERKVRIYQNTGDWDDPQDGLVCTQDLSTPESTCIGEVEFAHINPGTDDNLDLVVAEKWGRRIYVFLADSENPGVFPEEPSDSYTVRHNIYGLVVADLDNDGYNDVALAGALDDTQLYRDNVFVFWNDQDGTFDEPAAECNLDLGRDEHPHDLVVGHFCKTAGLALLDLVTANEDHNSISVLTNLGNREFSAERIDRDPSCQTSSWEFQAIVAGHFHLGKIIPDLACRQTSWPMAAIFHSDAQGGFGHDCEATQTDTYQLHPEVEDIGCWGAHCGHLNGGTKPDLAFAITSEDEVSVLLGKGDGTFQTPSADSGYRYSVDDDPNAESFPRDVRVVDLDMDGFGDLVTTNYQMDNISVLINKMVVAIPPAP